MKIKLNKREYIPFYVIAALIFAAFLVSVITFNIKKSGNRKCFIFPSVEKGKYILEYRNLSGKAYQGKINYFIDELLLGSSVERTKTLFSSGTKVESCFLQGNTLYLNLSDELLSVDENAIYIQDGVKLLEMNIKKNFHKVDKVVLFVNGTLAYDYL